MLKKIIKYLFIRTGFWALRVFLFLPIYYPYGIFMAEAGWIVVFISGV
jgi:hypothetical protein